MSPNQIIGVWGLMLLAVYWILRARRAEADVSKLEDFIQRNSIKEGSGGDQC